MDVVTAPLRFIRPQSTKPYFHSAQLTGGTPEFFFDSETHTVSIHDMRRVSETFSLDRHGFMLLPHQSKASDLHDDDVVQTAYYPELEALLTHVLDASRVVIFDSTRRSDREGGAQNPDGARRPADRVHVDYTTTSGPQRVRDILGDAEAEQLFSAGTRIRQINVWRPLEGPVVRSPLALADASSIANRDLVATEQHFPDRVGEIYFLAHTPEQRWYHASNMTTDEVLLIKGWDSLDDGRARFTPHTAFEHPETPPNAPPRESIETRTLVIG